LSQAKFIYDDKITPAIYELIEQAEEELIIVSPYISLWGHLINKLDKLRTCNVCFIARKNQEGKLDDLIKKMNEIRIELRVVENLHAKIYMNEKACIVSSMNLYEFSTSNSREIAVILQDKDTISDIRNYITEELVKNSNIVTEKTSDRVVKGLKSIVKFVSNQVQNDNKKPTEYKIQPAKNVVHEKGYCIRCRAMIKSNVEKPLCATCYDKWKAFGNKAYKEKYCHVCGRQEQTSIEKPVCISCYRKVH
jgi:phosphatidylserine/phosphatidylglycerophosphate/cardiolipin synthase-like enzyme